MKYNNTMIIQNLIVLYHCRIVYTGQQHLYIICKYNITIEGDIKYEEDNIISNSWSFSP